MLTLNEELGRLRQADGHIADAMCRIEQQKRLCESLPAGRDRARAEALLAIMKATLEQFSLHREAIREAIARLREGSTEQS